MSVVDISHDWNFVAEEWDAVPTCYLPVEHIGALGVEVGEYPRVFLDEYDDQDVRYEVVHGTLDTNGDGEAFMLRRIWG